MLDVRTHEERFDAPQVPPTTTPEVVVIPTNTLLGLIESINRTRGDMIGQDTAGPTNLSDTIRMALVGVTEEDHERMEMDTRKGGGKTPTTGNDECKRKEES